MVREDMLRNLEYINGIEDQEAKLIVSNLAGHYQQMAYVKPFFTGGGKKPFEMAFA